MVVIAQLILEALNAEMSGFFCMDGLITSLDTRVRRLICIVS